MWLLIIFASLAFLVYMRIKKGMNYWKDRNVPYIKPLPFIGNSTALLLGKESIFEQVERLYNVYPDKRYYGFFQFMKPQLLIRDLELIKQITVKDFDYFTDRTTFVNEDAEPILAKNLAGLSGQRWRDMRTTLSPSFTSSKMKFMFNLISDCAEQFTKYYENQGSEDILDVELKDAFSRFTNDAIASTAFGVTVNSLKDKENEFFLAGKDVSNFGGIKALKLFGYTLFPSLMRFFKVSIFSPIVTEFFKNIVNETIQLREEKGIVRPDLIHILLEARKERVRDDHEEVHEEDNQGVENELSSSEKEVKHHKAPLSDDDITAQALVFFFAGFETTSTFMSFLYYELAINPDIQLKLQHEIDETAKRLNGKLTYDAVMGMKYLDMVVSEGLRKWTPGFAIDRVCVKDYEIPAKQSGEASIIVEKGTTVAVPVIGIHYDPQYFPNPQKFDPDRFSDENKSSIAPFTYMPFGSGPRICIASRFALLEAKILLCHILMKFDVVPIAKTLIPMVLNRKSFSLVPKEGLWLGFKKRVNLST